MPLCARTVSSQPLFTRPDRGKTRRRALLMSRVGLEPLEDRCLMSSFHWASDVSGDFNSAANWVDQSDNPGVPGPNDDATIGYSGVTVTSSQSNTVGSLNDEGALALTGGTFAVANDSSVAQLTVAAGATLQVSGGTTTLSGGSADSVLSSTVSVASGATLDLTGGTVDLNSGAALTGAGEYLFGDATVNVNTPLAAPADLDLMAGTLAGAGPLTVTNTGTVLIPDHTGYNLDGLTLVNTGTVQFGQGVGAYLNFFNLAVINNQGTFNFDGADSLGGTGTINNTSTGAVLASVPPTQSLSMGGVTFNDLGGTIEVGSGNLDLGEGVSQGGTYTVAAGSDLELANGNNRTISGTFTGSGGGTVSILTLDHSLYLADSGATFDFPAGMLQLVGGSITVVTAGANPVLLNSGFMTVSAGGEFNWNAGTLQNVGTLTVGAVTGPSAAFNINNPAVVDNTGTIDLEGDVSLGGDGTLNNSGTLIAALFGDRIRSTQLQPPEQHRHDRRQVRHTQFQRFDRHAVERREQRRVGRSDRGDMGGRGDGHPHHPQDGPHPYPEHGRHGDPKRAERRVPIVRRPGRQRRELHAGRGRVVHNAWGPVQQRDALRRSGEHARRDRSVLAGEQRADDVRDRRHAGLGAVRPAHQHGRRRARRHLRRAGLGRFYADARRRVHGDDFREPERQARPSAAG